MSTEPSNSRDLFDVRKIRRLAELMNEHGLSEVDLRDGPFRVRLRKGGEVLEALPSRAVTRESAPRAAAAVAAPAGDANTAVIKSPMVGTFYMSSSPDTPPFVKVGDPVGPDTTVCIIEAMKVFNEIPAEIAGRIVAVLAENGAPVEFGQPLFKVETNK